MYTGAILISKKETDDSVNLSMCDEYSKGKYIYICIFLKYYFGNHFMCNDVNWIYRKKQTTVLNYLCAMKTERKGYIYLFILLDYYFG